MTSLKDKVMVVNLSISQWQGRKYDEKATREVEKIHDVYDAGRFNKLLIKSDTLKEIQSMAGKARQTHYDYTLPWGDNGDRILSTESYFKYLSEISAVKYQFDQLVEKFIGEYSSLKDKSRHRLGDLYRENDYPHEFTLKSKFGIKIVFMPIAESDDLRINVSKDMLDMMKQQVEGEMNSRVSRALDSVVDRAKEVIGKMYETLNDTDKIFRDSLVGNIESLVETIPILNFNNDPKLWDVQKKLRTLVVDPDQLRLIPKFRSEMAEKAKEVYDSL